MGLERFGKWEVATIVRQRLFVVIHFFFTADLFYRDWFLFFLKRNFKDLILFHCYLFFCLCFPISFFFNRFYRIKMHFLKTN